MFETVRPRAETPLILIVIDQYHPFIGGGEKQTRVLVRELTARGMRVTVITGRLEPGWPKREMLDGAMVLRVPHPRVRWLGLLWFLAALSRALLGHAADHDLIHVYRIGWHAAIAILVGRLRGRPVVIKLGNTGRHGDVARMHHGPLSSLLGWISRKATRVVATSSRARNELCEAGFSEEQIALLPNGVDTTVYNACPEDKRSLKLRMGLPARRSALYVGRLVPHKGLRVLLQAWQIVVRHTTVGAQLVLVGDGAEKSQLQEMVGVYGLRDRVTFVGAVEATVPYYQACDLFVLPSFYEGLSNALLEAMACGLPVVATRVSGNEDLVQDGESGLLIPAGDAQSLGGAILKLLRDHSLSKRMGAQAHHTVQESYSLDRSVSAYVRLYDELRDTAR